MRASTIFALIIAVLVGLGAAVAVKASGLLAPREAKKESPPPQVLVAANNLFEGNYLQASDVKLRPARNGEEVKMLKDGDLLPPMTQAAVKRVAKINIMADTPIRKDMLEDMNPPPDISARLLPNTRAVNVSVLKEHCAGCLIKPGDMVDVELITSVIGPDGTTTRGCTAIIARNAWVVAKRNSLYPMPGSVSGPCPCNYTLAVNAYRAGLIEFAKDKGIIALHPLSEAEKRDYEARLRPRGDGIVTASFSIPDSPEYADEDKRVAAYVSGNYVIGEKDLARLCQLAFTPADKIPSTNRIMKISGLTYAGDHVFDPTGSPAGFVGPGVTDEALYNAATANNPGSVLPTGPRGPTPNNYIPPGLNSPTFVNPFGKLGATRRTGDFRVGSPDPVPGDGRLINANTEHVPPAGAPRVPPGVEEARQLALLMPSPTCRSCQQR